MSKVLVIVTTDHIDSEQAIRSVSNAMKRAGYEVNDYDPSTFSVTAVANHRRAGFRLTTNTDGLVEVCEPEVLNDNP